MPVFLVTSIIFALFAITLASGCAHAQDCESTIKLTAENISRQSDVVKMAVLSEIVSTSFQESKQKYGGSLVIDGVPVTANAETFDATRKAFRQNTYSSFYQNRASELISSHGDDALVNGYIACKSGLIARFLNVTGRQATIKIEYFAPANAPDAELLSATPLGEAEKAGTSLSNEIRVVKGDCLHRPYVFKNRVPCFIDLLLDQPTTTFRFSIATTAGGASAPLPPRLKLVTETMELPEKYIPSGTYQSVEAVRVNTDQSGNNALVEACTAPLPAGFKIDGTPNTHVASVGYPLGPNTQAYITLQSPTKVCFITQCSRNGAFTACDGSLSGTMSRTKVEAIE